MTIQRKGRWLFIGRLHVGWLRFWHWPKYRPPVRWFNLITSHVWTFGKIGIRWEVRQPDTLGGLGKDEFLGYLNEAADSLDERRRA